MAAIKPLFAVLVSLLALFLYNRARPLYALYNNHPSRLDRLNLLNNPSVKFADKVRNCEDILLEEKEGFALLSCDPSRDQWNTVMGTFVDSTSSPETGIYVWQYTDPTATPEKLSLLDFNQRGKTFHPLGIEYHAPSNTIYAINHAPSGSTIEVFKFHPAEKAATHLITLSDPEIHAPNSLQILSETELLLTNDHLFRARFNPILAVLETYLAYRGGNVLYIRLNQPVTAGVAATKILLNVPFANGITQLDDSTFAVASSSMNAVMVYNMTRSDEEPYFPRLKQTRVIALPFHADNLSVDKNGKLLIAGHPHAPTLQKVAKGAAKCNAEVNVSGERCEKGLSWVAEWSEAEGLKAVFVGDEYGTSATAVRDVGRKIGVVAGLYSKGLYVSRG